MYREAGGRVERDSNGQNGGMSGREEKRKAKIHFLCRYKDLSRGRGHAVTAQDPLYSHYD